MRASGSQGKIKLRDCVESYLQMQKKNVEVDSNHPAIVGLLKACHANATSTDIIVGRLVHGKAIEEGRELDVYRGSILIDLYSKAGSIMDAENVFQRLGKQRNIVSWGALINGCARNGEEMRVFELLDEMVQAGIHPNEPILMSSLRASGNLYLAKQCRQLHDLVVKVDLCLSVSVCNKLIDVYAKCGLLSEAYNVFTQTSSRDIVSWNIMILGYAQKGHYLDALKMVERMQEEDDLLPEKVTFFGIIRACCNSDHARLLHNCILRSGLIADLEVGNALINMYIQHGSLEDAQKIFGDLPKRDLVSWTTLMVGFSHNDDPDGAIELFWKMLQNGIKPNQITFSCIIHAYGMASCFSHFCVIHDLLIRSGLQLDIAIENSLIHSYLNLGSLREGRKIFDGMSFKNRVSWTTIIVGYAQHEHSCQALELIREMQKLDIVLDEIVFACIPQVCAAVCATYESWLVHDCIIKVCENVNTNTSNALIAMYSRFYNLKDASKVFDGLQFRDAFSWDAIIMAHSQHGHASNVLECFWKMKQGGIEPVVGTLIFILKSCGSLRDLNQGRIVEDYIIRRGLESEVTIESSLIDMYVKLGVLKEACSLFDMASHKDVVTWGAMIDGFSELGHQYDALRLYERMLKERIEPNKAVYTSMLKACGRMGVINHGRFIHEQVLKGGFEFDSALGNSLIDMYARCGSLQEAQRVLDAWESRDKISWCILMAAYAKNDEIEDSYLKPLIDYFESSNKSEMYGRIIDALSRKGLLYVAEDLVKTMPSLPDDVSWRSVLSGCRLHGKLGMGRKCFENAVKIDPKNASTYVLMSDMHASSGGSEGEEFISELHHHESEIVMVNEMKINEGRIHGRKVKNVLEVGVLYTNIGRRRYRQEEEGFGVIDSCVVLCIDNKNECCPSLLLQLASLYMTASNHLAIFMVLFLIILQP